MRLCQSSLRAKPQVQFHLDQIYFDMKARLWKDSLWNRGTRYLETRGLLAMSSFGNKLHHQLSTYVAMENLWESRRSAALQIYSKQQFLGTQIKRLSLSKQTGHRLLLLLLSLLLLLLLLGNKIGFRNKILLVRVLNRIWNLGDIFPLRLTSEVEFLHLQGASGSPTLLFDKTGPRHKPRVHVIEFSVMNCKSIIARKISWTLVILKKQKPKS